MLGFQHHFIITSLFFLNLELVARLVGGSGQHQGRVEVNVKGTWGTICQNYFDKPDADVICRFLGFVESITVNNHATFGLGTSPMLLDELHCEGTEPSPFHCPHAQFGVHTCTHSQDAGLTCKRKFYTCCFEQP